MDKKIVDEITNLYLGNDFSKNAINNFINENYDLYIEKNIYPVELKKLMVDYYFPKNENKVNKLLDIIKFHNSDTILPLTAEEEKVILCKNLLFHNDNSINDRSRLELKLANMLIFHKKDIDSLTYEYVITVFKGENSIDDLKLLFDRLKYLNLKLDSKDSRIFGFKDCPYMNVDTIISNYSYISDSSRERYAIYNGESANTIIGRYGELLVFNELVRDESSYNIWVSKDVGDGFGYDLMSIDKITHKTKLIEVKTTITKSVDDCCLSYNEENQIYNLYSEPNIYEHYVKVVSLIDGKEPIIYTCKFDKEKSDMLADKRNWVFNVTSNICDEIYDTITHRGYDQNGKKVLYIPIPNKLKLKSRAKTLKK